MAIGLIQSDEAEALVHVEPLHGAYGSNTKTER